MTEAGRCIEIAQENEKSPLHRDHRLGEGLCRRCRYCHDARQKALSTSLPVSFHPKKKTDPDHAVCANPSSLRVGLMPWRRFGELADDV